MKTKLFFILATIATISFGITSCVSSQTTAQKQEVANEVREKVNDLDFTFKPNYAYPVSYRPIYLSPYYDVKVSSDTIVSYLPYFGRAYTASMDHTNGGIKFTSTDFDYKVLPGKKKGNWLIEINIKDNANDTSLLFDIWENGVTRLSVTDSKRQSISFMGELELEEKE